MATALPVVFDMLSCYRRGQAVLGVDDEPSLRAIAGSRELPSVGKPLDGNSGRRLV